MNNFLSHRESQMQEKEVQQITLKLARALKSMYDKKIFHRDLNINNVMLHFPDIEPRKQDLQDENILHRIDAQR